MAGSSSDEGEDNFDLNLAPIIDCFTVLITYMLVSASFLSLSMLEVQAPPSSTDPPPLMAELPKEVTAITVTVLMNRGLSIHLMGPQSKTIVIDAPASNTSSLRVHQVTLERLARFLKHAQGRFIEVKQISVKADRLVIYSDVAAVIEAIKPFYKTVVMGGA